jgi:hypothetical protein
MIIFSACIFCQQKFHQKRRTDHFCGDECLNAWEAKQVSSRKMPRPAPKSAPALVPVPPPLATARVLAPVPVPRAVYEPNALLRAFAASQILSWEEIARQFGSTFAHIERST